MISDRLRSPKANDTHTLDT